MTPRHLTPLPGPIRFAYAPLDPNLLASLLPRVDARLGLGVERRLRPDGTEAYATFYTPNNLAWRGKNEVIKCQVWLGCNVEGL